MARPGKTSLLERLRAGGNWLTGLAAVVALLLAVALLAEIVRTEREQREVTMAALSDYADIAAWQYVQGMERALRNRLHPALVGLRQAEPDAGPEQLYRVALAASERCSCQSREPERAWRFTGDRLVVSGEAPVPGREKLRRHLAVHLAAGRDAPDSLHGVDFITLDGEVKAVGYVLADSDRHALVGFVMPLEAVRGVFAEVFENTDLLPPALLGDVDPASILALAVGHDEQTLFEAGRPETPWRGEATMTAQSDRFTGLTVLTALRPEAADVLLVGGTPRSRLPLLITLLVLTVVLATLAVRQFNAQRRLVRMRTDTVARISHELRTPLTQIRLFVESLRLGRSRDREKALAVIDRESRRLDHLVNNVLRFGARGRDTEPLNTKALALADFLESVVDEFAPLADHYGVTVATEAEDGLTVHADPDALRRVVLNLLDNAARFSPADGRIDVSAVATDTGRVRIRVDDQGPGVAPAERERIWHMFGRVGAGERSGSGIGLAVVRHGVERHGGDARVTDAPGGGARFVIELPDNREGA